MTYLEYFTLEDWYHFSSATRLPLWEPCFRIWAFRWSYFVLQASVSDFYSPARPHSVSSCIHLFLLLCYGTQCHLKIELSCRCVFFSRPSVSSWSTINRAFFSCLRCFSSAGIFPIWGYSVICRWCCYPPLRREELLVVCPDHYCSLFECIMALKLAHCPIRCRVFFRSFRS